MSYDIWYKDAYVYFFENRSGEFSSFYQSNLKQASGRTRLGAKKITYCRTELANSRKDIFKGEIETLVHNFVNDNSPYNFSIVSVSLSHSHIKPVYFIENSTPVNSTSE